MSSHKTIAKNTLFLYGRMLFITIISLYTSRVVINALGLSDYGIYSVVAGVVGLLSFMHTALGSATTRFMNVEIGRKNFSNLKSAFNSAILIHLGLAVFIFIVAETLGLWYLYHKMNIPADRFFAAKIVYQFSIVAIMVNIVQIPYDAAIIAHQRMSVYAYISIVEAIFKLTIAYLIIISPVDKLITYAGLVLIVSIITRLIYQTYCYRNFEECRFRFVINREYIKTVISYFSWDLFGNFSLIAKNQGVQLLQNFFFGTVINAAASIASTVSGIVSGFSSNFSSAAAPQIVQHYAEGKNDEMFKLLFFSTRITFYLIFLFSVPFLIETNFILTLWLKIVGPYTAVFCQLILVQIVFSRLYTPINDAIHATGNIKVWSAVAGLVNIANLILTYVSIKIYHTPIGAYVVGIFCLIFSYLINLYFLKKNIPEFDISNFFVNTTLKNILISIVGFIPCFLLKTYLPTGFLYSVAIILGTIAFNIAIIFTIGLTVNERRIIFSKLLRRS